VVQLLLRESHKP